MKSNWRTKVFLVASLLLIASYSHAQPRQKDVGQDHPLLDRFPDSVIVRYKSDEFETLAIPLGKATNVDEFEKITRVEGKITRITYEMTKGHSTTEVFRSYRDALAAAGFEILYRCEWKTVEIRFTSKKSNGRSSSADNTDIWQQRESRRKVART